MKSVKLIKSHTHAGTEYQPGDTIIVPVSTAEYLEQYGIGREVESLAGNAPVVGIIDTLTVSATKSPKQKEGKK